MRETKSWEIVLFHLEHRRHDHVDFAPMDVRAHPAPLGDEIDVLELRYGAANEARALVVGHDEQVIGALGLVEPRVRLTHIVHRRAQKDMPALRGVAESQSEE